MKTFITSIVFTGALMMGAHALLAADPGNTWRDQLYQAKTGQVPPAEVARQRAEFQENATPAAVPPSQTWREQWYQAKYGRPSPVDQARLDAELASAAYREDTTKVSDVPPANTWRDQFYKAKLGRNTAAEESRQKVEDR
jgi:hypothetical protein